MGGAPRQFRLSKITYVKMAYHSAQTVESSVTQCLLHIGFFFPVLNAYIVALSPPMMCTYPEHVLRRSKLRF